MTISELSKKKFVEISSFSASKNKKKEKIKKLKMFGGGKSARTLVMQHALHF
jgi:hypothetical protein